MADFVRIAGATVIGYPLDGSFIRLFVAVTAEGDEDRRVNVAKDKLRIDATGIYLERGEAVRLDLMKFAAPDAPADGSGGAGDR